VYSETNSLLFRIVRRAWIVLLTLAIVVGVVSWMLYTAPTDYRTTVLLAVHPDPTLSSADMLRAQDLVSNSSLMFSYADVFNSPLIENQALEGSGIPAHRRSDYSARTTVEPDSSVLRVTVEGPDRDAVALLAQQVAQRGDEASREIFPLFQIRPLMDDDIRVTAVTLSWTRTLLLAAVVGLIVGVLAAFWLDSLLAYRARGAATRTSAHVETSPGGHAQSPGAVLTGVTDSRR
jgi:capsular polysaccharide biosynthesis protein